MIFVDLPSGVRIRYDERGPRDATPLVLAHGFGASLEMWWPQREPLSQRYRLITWDARGQGQSPPTPDIEAYTMPALAADLRGLLEAIDAVEDAVIGGMSFGGQIALQYAVDHPADTRALVLSDTTTRGASARPPSLTSQDAMEQWAGDPGIEGGRHAMQTRPDLSAQLPALDVPALVIVGTEDAMILPGLPRLVDALPRRRVVRLAGCTHGTSAQRPAEWTAAVLFFLADLEAGRPIDGDEVR